jgi:hypothetical protein
MLAQTRERVKLTAFGIEIFRREPGLESTAQARPLIICDGKPCRIAAALFVNDRVEKDAFDAEAEPQRRAAGGRVQRVALPLVAPVAEVLEGVAHHQVLDLRRGAGVLQLR